MILFPGVLSLDAPNWPKNHQNYSNSDIGISSLVNENLLAIVLLTQIAKNG